jgi:oligoribonuclease NrnB/cAMP/cGMP phosphodiesterase (DHH superfamily)
MSKILNIIYHGNCIDGWFSAYVIYDALKDKYEDVQFIAISPNQQRTWPSMEIVLNTDVILTDVSVNAETLSDWESVAKSVFCIDHHETTKTTLGELPKEKAIHDMDACATLIAWRHYHPEEPVPEWIMQINRIDMWQDITDDDRAIREILNPIAHECENHFQKTEQFIANFDNPDYHRTILREGHEELARKDEGLQILLKKGRIITIHESDCERWGLPSDSWEGKRGFIMDTTGIVLDSTEAGYLALRDHPEADFFCNFRTKNFLSKGRKQETAYVYSARARPGIDLTAGGVFAGHKTSAGANRVKGQATVPFV